MAKHQHSSGYDLIPAFLRQMREKSNLTQRDLAAKLGRAQTWVHKSELGQRRVDVAEFLDWCLGCDVKADEACKALVKLRK